MADVFKQSQRWVKRMRDIFEHLDFNKNGYLSVEDWTIWIDNIQRDINPDPALVEILRQKMTEYCAGIGLTPGVQLTQDEFVEKFANFAAAEKARHDRGEQPLLFKLNEAWYDVVDINRNGSLSLEEYSKVMSACNFAASSAFMVLDKNRDGRVERSELNEQQYKFWFSVEDAHLEGMLGKMV